jgi:hypothetical protein
LQFVSLFCSAWSAINPIAFYHTIVCKESFILAFAGRQHRLHKVPAGRKALRLSILEDFKKSQLREFWNSWPRCLYGRITSGKHRKEDVLIGVTWSLLVRAQDAAKGQEFGGPTQPTENNSNFLRTISEKKLRVL